MKITIFACCVIFTVASCQNSDGWVWKDGDQDGKPSSRYFVQENVQESSNDRPFIGFRPQNTGQYGSNSRPAVPGYPGNKGGVLVGPGGPTGIVKRPPFEGNPDDFDSGNVPPWIKDDPRYRDYDTCRCRYSFNCPSSGLKFGSCSKDKKYCCFSSRKYPALVSGPNGGGQYPIYQGPPNKYGPVSFVQSPNYYGNRRPPGGINGGNKYPSGNYFSGGNGNSYPKPNPYDQNYDYDIDAYSRSSKSNQTEADSSEETP